MILQRYVARRFVRQFLMVLAVFAAILFLIDIIEERSAASGAATSA